jgi:thioredoxin 1
MEFDVTTDNFATHVKESAVPVLVDFWADWCMPCKMIEPVLADIAKEYDGKVAIGRLNVDEQGEIAAEHNVVSIPTLLLFKGGEVVAQHVGAAPKETLVNFLSQHVEL